MTDPELESMVEEARVAINKAIWWVQSRLPDDVVAELEGRIR